MANQTATYTASDTAPFAPDWVSPPGDTILDLLEERDWTQNQLSDRLGYSTKHVSQLINGKVPLSEDAAIRLQNVFGAPVGFWLKREAQYRERTALMDAAERHAGMVSWLEQFPIKELMNAGAISKRRIDAKSRPGLVADLLAFFGVATPDQWQSHYGDMQMQFRRSRSEQANIGAISAWLRMGEQLAEKADGPRYDEAHLRAKLTEIRALTQLPQQEFEPQLKRMLQEAGVILVLVPAIPGAHVSGVARWLNPHRPLIQLSLYGRSNDRFWFTLFHELAHILLHSKEKKSVFLDDPSKADTSSKEEQQANAWARDFLIPTEQAQQLAALGKNKTEIRHFAKKSGIHPGIVVGRLQHEKLIAITWMNDLKDGFQFSKTG